MIEQLTLETFKEKVMNYEENIFKGNLPIIVDFSADSWCRPCIALSPILEEISKEYSGKINIYKVDVEQETELSTIFNIRSVPTILFYSMNGQADKSSGSLPKSKIINIIETKML